MPQFGPWLPTSPFEVFHKVALPTSPNWSCQCRGRWGQWRYHLRHLNQNEIMGYALAPVQCVWQVGQCKADHILAAKFHGLSCINGFGSCRALVGPTRYKVPPSGIGIGNWHEKAHSSNQLKTAKEKHSIARRLHFGVLQLCNLLDIGRSQVAQSLCGDGVLNFLEEEVVD